MVTSNFEFNKFALLLSKYDYKVKQYDILAGVVIGLETTHALVDIGLKKVAFLPLQEIYVKVPNEPKEVLDMNFVGEFLILYLNKRTNQTIVSLKQIHSLYLWERLKQIDLKNTIIYAKSEHSIGRGKILDFNGLKLYALNLHIPKYYRRKREKRFFIPFKFLEIKDFLHVVQVNAKLALFNKSSINLKLNETYKGTIISIKIFGIFINLLGLQCLLHISEISRKKLLDLTEFYKPGEQIQVQILYKDIGQGKVFLTLKEVNSIPPRQL
uniref:30S ribosomal protein S1 n=1 Tax=Dictyopteris divaricata TaxID=156996 RepID=A0A2I4Q389_9PHAE|nr:30S ribosomal protein S1 [Dictyopteris divaricata]YP_010205374.1 30S ribosomal protein S1 [Grateloupia livida]AQZ25085.1 30S ribosomal protein S1 [Dictyopteris divaricata]UAV85943.1 30S ribosomal protein S1 [Grateloupia livida]